MRVCLPAAFDSTLNALLDEAVSPEAASASMPGAAAIVSESLYQQLNVLVSVCWVTFAQHHLQSCWRGLSWDWAGEHVVAAAAFVVVAAADVASTLTLLLLSMVATDCCQLLLLLLLPRCLTGQQAAEARARQRSKPSCSHCSRNSQCFKLYERQKE